MAHDKNQTPAPKVSHRKDLSERDTPELKKSLKNAEKGTAKKTGATKTPQKIQEGNTDKHKREY